MKLQNFSMNLRSKMSQVAVTILEKRMAEMVTDLIDTFLIRGEKVVPQNIRMNRLKF